MTQPHSSAKAPAQSRSHLRKTLLALRCNTDALQRQQWDAAIGRHLLAWCRQHRPASLGVFWPIQAEPDLRSSYPLLQQMGIQLALPLVLGKAQPLLFLAWQPGDAMERDHHGIPVPAQRDAILQPDAVLIPCLGFNSDQFRMGYGGGYYDRTLASLARPFAIGIAYHQAQTEFTAESHDVAMDAIITEK